MFGELSNHLWQSTVFAAVAGLLILSLRKNRAQVRYWLWFTASFKFLVPFSLLMSLGSHVHWAPATKNIATPAVSFTVVQITQPFPESMPFVASTPGDGKPTALFALWACGLGMIVLIRFRGWRRIHGAVRASVPIEIRAPVEVRSSPGLLEPGVVGWRRPVLLLPAGITERLTPPQLEAVLAHELCHVRRRDNLLASIHMLVEAMCWFHPLVWWIGARLVEERERACDEAVLSLGSEPRVYAEGILNVCKLYVESPLVCVSGVTGSDIKKRIEAIMANRIVLRLNFTKKLALTVAGFAALAMPIAIGIISAPRIRAQSQPSKIRSDLCQARLRGRLSGAVPGQAERVRPVMTFVLQAYGRFATGHFNPNLAAVPIEGGPAWMKSENYQINAKAEGNASEEMMRGPMLQALLEDRFKLKIHRETRDLPMYALTVAKSGPKLTQFKEGGCTPPDLTKVPPAPPVPGQKLCDYRVGRGKGLNLAVDAQGRSLADLSRLLGVALDRPVVDKTGIAGVFDIHLEFAIDQTTPNFLPGGPLDAPGGGPPAGPAEPAGGPSIFTAIQEQLGLKLEPVKEPGEFLVVDSVEKPSGN